jgi:transcriptional regulator with XRE-family HTH domain
MRSRLSSFAARLRSARLALGARRGAAVSQTEFSALAQPYLGATLHQHRLSRLESGNALPSIDEALALAVAAEVSVSWLAYGLDVQLHIGDDGRVEPDVAALQVAEAEAFMTRPDGRPSPTRPRERHPPPVALPRPGAPLPPVTAPLARVAARDEPPPSGAVHRRAP